MSQRIRFPQSQSPAIFPEPVNNEEKPVCDKLEPRSIRLSRRKF